MCSENQQNCISACVGATDCQVQCKKDFKCGAIDPTKVNSTSTASTSSSAATATKTKASTNDDDEEADSGTGFAKAGSTTTDDAEEDEDTTEEDTSAGVLAFGSAYGVGLFSVAIAGAAALL